MIEYLFSCEYATCTVPDKFRGLFRGAEEIVTSSSGWQPGALNLAQAFAMRFRTPLIHSEVTRLLIDVEQSGDARWSGYSSELSESTLAKLAERHDQPYRDHLHQRIRQGLTRHGRVLHVMVHTDSDHHGRLVLETGRGAALASAHACAWLEQLQRSHLDIHHEPDCRRSPLARELDETHATEHYARIRLKVSQRYFLEGLPMRWPLVKKHLLESLAMASRKVDAVSDREVTLTGQG